MTQPLDPHTLRQAAARWPRETLSTSAAQSFLRSLAQDAAAQLDEQPATVDVAALATRLHDAACGCGEPLAGTWSSYWQKIARAAVTELQPATVDEPEPAADEWPPGSCEQCGHRWADHDERDGCGACALTFTRSCHGWPL